MILMGPIIDAVAEFIHSILTVKGFRFIVFIDPEEADISAIPEQIRTLVVFLSMVEIKPRLFTDQVHGDVGHEGIVWMDIVFRHPVLFQFIQPDCRIRAAKIPEIIVVQCSIAPIPFHIIILVQLQKSW